MFGSIPLGWLQLKAQKLRLVAAIMGITFAVILIFVQLEFREALFVSAVRYHTAMDYDLAMLSPKTDFMVSSKQFPRARLYQTLGFDGVESATAVYMRLVSWRNPVDPSNARNILAIGFDPSEPGFERLLSAEQVEAIKIPDQAIFDRRGRDEYGPVRELLDEGRPVSAEINDRRVTIAGMYEVGTSFGLDGGVITSDLNFLRLLPTREKSAIDFGLIKLEPGQDAVEVQARIREAIPMDVRLLTRQEFMNLEIQYWNKTTPIGYIFAFGAVMGLIVGLIIVYQILFADVQDHLKEYATLKAMGYTHGYLRKRGAAGGRHSGRAWFSAGARDRSPRVHQGRRRDAFATGIERAKCARRIRTDSGDVRGLGDDGPPQTAGRGSRRGVLMDGGERIALEDVSYSFGKGALEKQILFDISTRIDGGEIVILTGPSGSGKTTLLTLIGALRSAQKGGVKVLGQELLNAREKTLIKVRRQIGYIFQSHNLLDSLTIHQNVQMALQLGGVKSRDGKDRIATVLRRVGLGEYEHKYPGELSGGQKQRAGIARALVNRPQIVLADEPTASLDKRSGRDVVELIQDLAREDGSAVILVTHDNRILDVADRILHLEDGHMKSLSEVVSEGASRMLNLLEKHDPNSANYLATFSFALARIAYADGEVSDSERDEMRRILHEVAKLESRRGGVHHGNVDDAEARHVRNG